MRTTTILGCMAMMALAVAGCGDDDGPSGGVDSGPAGVDSGGDPAGLCENAADTSGLMAMYTVEGEMQDVPTISGNCARMCALAGGDEMTMASCTQSCIRTNTMMGISDPCIGCLLMSIACARDNCLGDCLSDPSSADCLACQCGMNDAMINCREVFSDCSGVSTTTCPGT